MGKGVQDHIGTKLVPIWAKLDQLGSVDRHFAVFCPFGKAPLTCNPPDPLQSPETGNPENTIFETKKWTFEVSPSDPFK